MVRKKCEWYPGSIYHITTRGNRRSIGLGPDSLFKNNGYKITS